MFSLSFLTFWRKELAISAVILVFLDVVHFILEKDGSLVYGLIHKAGDLTAVHFYVAFVLLIYFSCS